MTTCSSSASISLDKAVPLRWISGQTWKDSAIASAPLRALGGFVAAGDQDPAAEVEPQRVIDVVEDGQPSPQTGGAILLGRDRLQRVALGHQAGCPCVDRPEGGLLVAGCLLRLFRPASLLP